MRKAPAFICFTVLYFAISACSSLRGIEKTTNKQFSAESIDIYMDEPDEY